MVVNIEKILADALLSMGRCCLQLLSDLILPSPRTGSHPGFVVLVKAFSYSSIVFAETCVWREEQHACQVRDKRGRRVNAVFSRVECRLACIDVVISGGVW